MRVFDLSQMKVVVVATNASTRFGGEAILPWHYFRLLRKRGVEAWLVAHERTRLELTALLPDEVDRMRFVPDRTVQIWLNKMSKPLPKRVADITLGWMIGIYTSWMQRKIVRELVTQYDVDVVHEPIPVSPRQPSLMYGVGAPVVIGPMNGGMNYPPGFAKSQGLLERCLMWTGRIASNALNAVLRGKREAAILLVANERTRQVLPRGTKGEVIVLTENGVDLTVFRPAEGSRSQSASARPKFAFVGRLIELKGVDLLLKATARALRRHDLELHIIGDGKIRLQLESLAAALALGDCVVFHGFISQDQCAEFLAGFDALVLPSLCECGGAVVIEAMATGLPVIATKWGGPADYLDERTGILIEPTGPESFICEIAEAMVRLAQSAELRAQLGQAARTRVVAEFDWERKIDFILEVYARAMQSPLLEWPRSVTPGMSYRLQKAEELAITLSRIQRDGRGQVDKSIAHED
jgi:glycosyltransferase involved in cell wall biosynthesis